MGRASGLPQFLAVIPTICHKIKKKKKEKPQHVDIQSFSDYIAESSDANIFYKI